MEYRLGWERSLMVEVCLTALSVRLPASLPFPGRKPKVYPPERLNKEVLALKTTNQVADELRHRPKNWELKECVELPLSRPCTPLGSPLPSVHMFPPGRRLNINFEETDLLWRIELCIPTLGIFSQWSGQVLFLSSTWQVPPSTQSFRLPFYASFFNRNWDFSALVLLIF